MPGAMKPVHDTVMTCVIALAETSERRSASREAWIASGGACSSYIAMRSCVLGPTYALAVSPGIRGGAQW